MKVQAKAEKKVSFQAYRGRNIWKSSNGRYQTAGLDGVSLAEGYGFKTLAAVKAAIDAMLS